MDIGWQRLQQSWLWLFGLYLCHSAEDFLAPFCQLSQNNYFVLVHISDFCKGSELLPAAPENAPNMKFLVTTPVLVNIQAHRCLPTLTKIAMPIPCSSVHQQVLVNLLRQALTM